MSQSDLPQTRTAIAYALCAAALCKACNCESEGCGNCCEVMGRQVDMVMGWLAAEFERGRTNMADRIRALAQELAP